MRLWRSRSALLQSFAVMELVLADFGNTFDNYGPEPHSCGITGTWPIRSIAHKNRHPSPDIEIYGLYTHLMSEPRPAIFIGHSMGCQVIIEFVDRYPELSKAIVLLLGTAGKALDTFGGNPNSPIIFQTIRALAFSIGPKLNRNFAPTLRSRIAWPFAVQT